MPARFMASIQEEEPDAYQLWQDREADGALYREQMHGLYAQLDGLYRSGLPPDEVVARKEAVIAAFRDSYGQQAFRLDGYRRALDADRQVNNASLGQFRVYNTGATVFAEALERFDGDLPAFVVALRTLPAAQRRGGKGWDPYAAVALLGPPSPAR